MHRPLSIVLALAAALAAGGCVQRNVIDSSLAEGEATLAGKLVAVDTAPWAYDGNAVVQVAVPGHGIVAVHLPARWNLCAAPPVPVEAFAIGDDVRVRGTVGADGAVVVCEGSDHGITPVD